MWKDLSGALSLLGEWRSLPWVREKTLTPVPTKVSIKGNFSTHDPHKMPQVHIYSFGGHALSSRGTPLVSLREVLNSVLLRSETKTSALFESKWVINITFTLFHVKTTKMYSTIYSPWTRTTLELNAALILSRPPSFTPDLCTFL